MSAAQWLCFMLLVRNCSKTDVGEYAFALALTAPLFMLAGFGAQPHIASSTDPKGELRQLFRLTSVGGLVALAITICLLVARNTPLHESLMVLGVAVNKLLERYSLIARGCMQQSEQFNRMGQSLMYNGLLGLGCFALTIMLTQSAVAATWSLPGATILMYWCFDRASTVSASARADAHPTTTGLWSLAIQLLPLSAAAALVSLGTNIPRYLVELQLGKEALAVFAGVGYFVVAGRLVLSSTSQALLPRFARLYSTGNWRDANDLLWKLIQISLTVGAFIVVASILVGDDALKLVYGEGYVPKGPVFPLLMTALVVRSVHSMLAVASRAQRRYRQLFLAELTTVVVSGVACYMLINRFEMVGAALGILMAALFASLVMGFVVASGNLAIAQRAELCPANPQVEYRR